MRKINPRNVLLPLLPLLLLTSWSPVSSDQADKERAHSQAIFVLERPLPQLPSELPVYRVIDPQVTKESVRQLMQAFKMSGEIVDREKLFAVRDGARELVYWKAKGTGYVRFSDEARLFEDKEVEELPDEKEARKLGKAFLEANDLLPENAVASETGYIGYKQFDPREQVTTKETRLGIQVGFGVELDGVPVEGPGAKASVVLGRNGEIIAAYKMWRDIEPGDKKRIISPEEAFALFKRRWPPEAPADPAEKAGIETIVKVGDVFTRYYAYPAPQSMQTLDPVYVFTGQYLRSGTLGGKEIRTVDGFRVLIPAVPDDERIPWSM